MTAFFLDRMTWPQIEEQIRKGYTTIIVPLGSTEQHGLHLPLSTDSVIGDALGHSLAERLEAFLAPTLRFGCSEHHMGFAGTISLASETFCSVVKDIVRCLVKHGFETIILLPTHGGNFAPLREICAELDTGGKAEILAFTDLAALMEVAAKSSAGFGVEPAASGAHSGEWETSIMLAINADDVRMQAAKPGFLGTIPEIMAKLPSGMESLDQNGVLGDPLPAGAAAGKQYLEDLVEFLHDWVKRQCQECQRTRPHPEINMGQ